MRNRRHPSALVVPSLALGALGAWSPLPAQAVRLTLVDPATGRAIPAAGVALLTADDSTATAATAATAKTTAATATHAGTDGSWAVRAPAPGVYRLRAQTRGNRTVVSPAVELRGGDQIQLVWRLAPTDTAVLVPVVVRETGRRPSTRLTGFRARAARRQFGQFLTRDDIERRNAVTVADLLRTVPGLEVLPSPRGFGSIVRTTEGCTPMVYVDGVRYPLYGETIDDIVNPTALEGIEVYAHAAEVPAEFQTPGASCGAIVLWTREP